MNKTVIYIEYDPSNDEEVQKLCGKLDVYCNICHWSHIETNEEKSIEEYVAEV